MAAVQTGNVAAVTLLLQNGADVFQRSNPGWSSAFVVTASGHLSVLQLLMQHGVEVRAPLADDFTMLMQAARSNQPHIAKLLISACS
jgi:ankyrin repeat protein